MRWPPWVHSRLAILVTFADSDDAVKWWRPNTMRDNDQTLNAWSLATINRNPPDFRTSKRRGDDVGQDANRVSIKTW